MTQRRSTQLQQIRELASSREHELAREVSELSHRQQSEEATLVRLQGYLDEYAGTAHTRARRVHEVDNERRFVERLGKAVRQQVIQVERLVALTRQATQRWHQARAEVQALERLIEARELEQKREMQRREQRDDDARYALRSNHVPEVFQ